MKRLIVLTGAPPPSVLRWDEDALSCQHNVTTEGAVDNTRPPESTDTFSAQWRQVQMRGLHTEIDQQNADSMPSTFPGGAIFSTPAELTQHLHSQPSMMTSTSVSTDSMQTVAVDLDDFYAQSLALHEDIATSQLPETQSQTTNPNDTLWSDEKTKLSLPNCSEHARASLPFPISSLYLNDVKDIPSAAYLRSIEPQTMTVNVVVGIMALPSPRPVTVGRRWGREREMQLLEILVGDDTGAGFEITVWLSDIHGNERLADRSSLEIQMRRLRPRDIVLLRNIALCTYQGRVHGQSLRKDVTKVDLLYRRKLDDSD